jgi:putative redox protein
LRKKFVNVKSIACLQTIGGGSLSDAAPDARRYLARHDLPTDGLAVEATFDMGSKPARVAGIDLRLIVPEGVPADRLDAMLAVATHCTVHNTLASEPDVSITLADAPKS